MSAPLADANAPLQLVRAATGPKLIFARNDTSVAADEEIGVLRFYGNDSDGTYQNCAQISVEADLDHGTNDKPTRILFSTTNDGESSPTERLRITSSGNVGIGTTNPQEKLDVDGTIQCLNELRSKSGNDLLLNAGSVNRDVKIQVNDINMLYVKGSNSSVGIGTDDPSQTLDLNSFKH